MSNEVLGRKAVDGRPEVTSIDCSPDRGSGMATGCRFLIVFFLGIVNVNAENSLKLKELNDRSSLHVMRGHFESICYVSCATCLGSSMSERQSSPTITGVPRRRKPLSAHHV